MLRFLLLVLPPAEILLMMFVAHRYGWMTVILAFIAGFFVGSSLIRLRGKVFFQQAMAAAQRNEAPTEALVGGIGWYVAGLLFMIPGFITDALGLIVLLPPVRRRLMGRFAALAQARVVGMSAQGSFRWPPEQGGYGQADYGQGSQAAGPGDVFEGEARRVDDPPSELPPASGAPGENPAPRSPEDQHR